MFYAFHMLYPNVRKITEKTDYCTTCHIHKQNIKYASNEVERDTAESLLNTHLELAAEARESYKFENVEPAKLSEPSLFQVIDFDWAKNWELPKYLNQPGDLYFLSCQKIGIFAINNEGSDDQTFFCSPEVN